MSKEMTEEYKGHKISYQFDLDWHVKIDGVRFSTMYLSLQAAEKAARQHIDDMKK